MVGFLCNCVLQSYDVLFQVLQVSEHCQIFLTMNLILATSYFEPKPDLMPMMLWWCVCFVVEESKGLLIAVSFFEPGGCYFSKVWMCYVSKVFSHFISKVLHTFSRIFLHFYLGSFTYLSMIFHLQVVQTWFIQFFISV